MGSDPSEIASQLSQCETVVTPYALSVSANPNLTSLSLPSLCEIGGGLLLVNNPNLCLSLDMLLLITNSSSDMCVTWNGHKDNRRCGMCTIKYKLFNYMEHTATQVKLRQKCQLVLIYSLHLLLYNSVQVSSYPFEAIDNISANANQCLPQLSYSRHTMCTISPQPSSPHTRQPT